MAKMKNVTVRGYNIDDVPAMAEIWNEVVKEGNAFPQKETLDYDEAKKFFNDKVYDATIARNIRLAEAPSFGLPIMLYDDKCKGAIAYKKFAKEFLSKQ